MLRYVMNTHHITRIMPNPNYFYDETSVLVLLDSGANSLLFPTTEFDLTYLSFNLQSHTAILVKIIL